MSSPKKMQVTIVIATYRRLPQFQQCIGNVFASIKKMPQIEFQFLIGLNGEDEAAETWLLKLKHSEIFEMIKYEERLSPPAVRNLLVEKARGEWICFIDDDAYTKENYFCEFLNTLNEFPDCGAIGGPNLTPKGSSWFQNLTGTILSSRLATFFSSRRYRPVGKSFFCGEESLILCNLFVLKSALGRAPFPNDLVCCEEGWLLDTLQKQGFSLVYNPELIVWHDRRSTLRSFVQQVFKYGLGRGQVLRRRLRLGLFIHLIPTICVLYSLSVFMLAINQRLPMFYFVPFLIYIPLCMLASLICVVRDDFSMGRWLIGIGLFSIIHTTYGVGLAWGFVKK